MRVWKFGPDHFSKPALEMVAEVYMPYRKSPLVNAGVYHIFTKSIAGFTIFNSDKDYERMRQAVFFYRAQKPPSKFSLYASSGDFDYSLLSSDERLVRILAYCLMPTHVHLLLEQVVDDGISRYMNLILKSYSKYFNVKYKRKGPLWEGRFGNVLVEKDDQLLHLTRYIHLNPVSLSLVNAPQDWRFSSYNEYVGNAIMTNTSCEYRKYVTLEAAAYKKFVEDRSDYQRKLEWIKHLTID